MGRGDGGKIHKGLFRRRRENKGAWEGGLFGRRKRGENTKMDKRARSASILSKLTQLQIDQVWVNEMICQVPKVFLNMLNETYNKWASFPCSEMGYSKHRREANIFLAEEEVLSLMCDIFIANPCG